MDVSDCYILCRSKLNDNSPIYNHLYYIIGKLSSDGVQIEIPAIGIAML